MVIARFAPPRAITDIDRALATVRGIRRLVRARKAVSRICTATAVAMVPSGTVGWTAITLIAVATGVIACARAVLIRAARLVGAADTLAVLMIELRIAAPSTVVHVDGALADV